MAQLTGAAPLYLGNREKCTFIGALLGMFKIDVGSINPYATTIIKSGFISFINVIISLLFFSLKGWMIGILCIKANFFVGQGITFCPLLCGLSGLHTNSFIL